MSVAARSRLHPSGARHRHRDERAGVAHHRGVQRAEACRSPASHHPPHPPYRVPDPAARRVKAEEASATLHEGVLTSPCPRHRPQAAAHRDHRVLAPPGACREAAAWRPCSGGGSAGRRPSCRHKEVRPHGDAPTAGAAALRAYRSAWAGLLRDPLSSLSYRRLDDAAYTLCVLMGNATPPTPWHRQRAFSPGLGRARQAPGRATRAPVHPHLAAFGSRGPRMITERSAMRRASPLARHPAEPLAVVGPGGGQIQAALDHERGHLDAPVWVEGRPGPPLRGCLTKHRAGPTNTGRHRR
ncbi:DUF5133 domain-containing protein [Streptomyces avermitilis]|uniref:DUF5133 domain-containing protein n=1 Tax=Streptomyces avermitilis TaxID=33903 RepID=UPI003690064D